MTVPCHVRVQVRHCQGQRTECGEETRHSQRVIRAWRATWVRKTHGALVSGKNLSKMFSESEYATESTPEWQLIPGAKEIFACDSAGKKWKMGRESR